MWNTSDIIEKYSESFIFTVWPSTLNVNEARYLGVIIDSKLNFNSSVCKKVNSTLAFLKRKMYLCKCEIKSDAYFIYVRPILEYAVCYYWAPYAKCNTDKLEPVQWWAARFVMKDYHPTSSVTVMINKRKWSSLHHRTDTIRLQMMYKITHQLVDMKLSDYITYNHGTTRGHYYKLTIPFSRTDSYKYSYFPTTIKLWNKLLKETVNATSINDFTDLATYLYLILFCTPLLLLYSLVRFCNYNYATKY